MAEFKDYYEILELKRSASAEEIKQAYRRLARKHHPDLNQNNASAELKFREVQEAYDVLGNDARRRHYDSLGTGYRSGMDFQMPSEWAFRPGGASAETAAGEVGGGLGGFSEFFDMLFGGGTRVRMAAQRNRAASANRTARKGNDVETILKVTLEEIHQGVSKKMQLHLQAICPTCQGSGLVAENRCGVCEGRGMAPRLKTIDIKIPPAARDGTRLRLSGQGEMAPGGGEPGDLYVKIQTLPHPIFTPDGKNILVEIPVAPWEAVLGGEVDVPTLDGIVKMKLPPGTQNGVKMRLQHRGLRTENGRGDEIVRIKIVIPTEVTDRERHLFRQLRDISHFRPRVKDRSTQ